MENGPRINDKCVWETVLQNDWFPQIAPLFGKEFPVEVRSMLSDWFSKDNSFMSFNLNEPDHLECSNAFIEALLNELWKRINAFPSQGEANFHHKQRLFKLLTRLQAQDRLHLFQVIRETLTLEKQRVEGLYIGKLAPVTSQSSQQTTTPAERTFSQIQEEIDLALAYIQQKCQEIDHKIPEMSNSLQSLRYNLYQLQNNQQNIGNGNVDDYHSGMPLPSESELQNHSIKLSQDMQALHAVIMEAMALLSGVHETVQNELEKWRDDQRLITLGKPADNTFEVIEKWFKIIGNSLTILEQKLPEFKDLCQAHNLSNESSNIPAALKQIEFLRHAMVNVSLVITKEPKQIIRTGPNFGPVRLVVLPFCPNRTISSVKAVFINEKTANDFFNNSNNKHEELPVKSGELKFGKGSPSMLKNRIDFQTMTVTKVAKSSKRGEQFVVEERFWIYFRVTVCFKGRSILLYTTSLPISVTSHPVQEGKAWTNVVWYNAFPMKSRQRFQVPDFIQWTMLIETINLEFIKLGKGLAEEQKDYLKSKLFTEKVPKDEMVSKALFLTDIIATVEIDPKTSEDGSSTKSYTFGEWLFYCIKILSWVPKNGKHAQYGVRKFWEEGRIIGFMSTEEMETRLRGSNPGTFIIRFPENRPENICLYWHNISSAYSKGHLLKQLLSINDFKIKALQDRILENPAAIYLYPNIIKADAFTKMSKSDCSIVDGYFKVGMHEDFSSILQRIINNFGGDHIQSAPSPSSSHSARSYLSHYSAVNSPSGESVRSDHSSTTGSCAYSPESSTQENVEKFLDGVDSSIFDNLL